VRLVTYSTGDGAPTVGVLEDGRVHPLGGPGADMIEYIEHGRDADRLPPAGEDVALEEVRLHAPVPKPGKIIAIGLNYSDHAAETGQSLPEKPIVFAKYNNTVVGPGEPILIPEAVTQEADYEAELVVVIGRTAKNVPVGEALDYVFGYTNGNDVSARDLQRSEGGQWTRAKSLDTFGPMGPWLVTADEVGDPQDLSIRCLLNGEVMQDGTTAKMAFSVAELISFLSHGTTLDPGDVIFTGTPPGVGMARDPKVFLKPGDEVTVEIQGLGSLTNPVEAAS